MKDKLKKVFSEAAGDNRGIAILFTLGILSLLLIIGLAFSASSITERRAATNNNAQTRARLLAQSAIQRALVCMEYQQDKYSYIMNASSHLTGTPDSWAFDSLHHIETLTPDNYKYNEWKREVYDHADTSTVQWQYVFMNHDGNGMTPNKIIGRYAYQIVTAGGRLDPSACVDTSVVSENGANEERPGVNVYEINLQGLDPAATTLTNAHVAALSTTAAPGGKLPYNAVSNPEPRWSDMETLIYQIGGAGIAAELRGWFTVGGTPETEAFWRDINADGKQEEAEYFHRFNLARKDWDLVTTDSVLASAVRFSDTPTTDSPSGITWLNKWNNAGSFIADFPVAGVVAQTACAKQIAANLIDYCDSDLIATTDNQNQPTYTGNDDTPYINELGFEVGVLFQRTQLDLVGGAPNPDTERFSYTFTITGACGEVAYIYNNGNGPTTAVVKASKITILDGDFNATITRANGTTPLLTKSLNGMVFEIDQTVGAPYSYNAQSGVALTLSDVSDIAIGSAPGNAVLADARIQLRQVKLEFRKTAVLPYEFADFAYPDKVTEYSASLGFTSAVNVTDNYYYSYKADDPRQNLLPDDWATATAQANAVSAQYSAMSAAPLKSSVGAVPTGAVNQDVTCATIAANLGDSEAGSTPTTVSTAYIRNAPMKSPWEIGAIHRGSQWATINLKKFNTTDTGGGIYDRGDANILDQIKMTDDTHTYGKVNLNSTKNEVLTALFMNIYVGSGYDSPGSQVTAGVAPVAVLATPADAITIAAAVKALSPLKTRAEIVSHATGLHLTDGTYASQNTNSDAEKEEIIGKFINLTKVGSVDEIVVIVLGQAIKDISGVTLNRDFNGNGVVDDTNVLNSGNPDEQKAARLSLGFALENDSNLIGNINNVFPVINETVPTALGRYDLGGDVILGEQKIKVKLARDNISGKWKILEYEYMED